MKKEKILSLPPIMVNCKMYIGWNSKISGIYSWVNEINGKMYIGRSVNLYKRVYDEMNGFRNGKEQNMKKLFRAIQKYNIENFRVVRLLECPPINLNQMEQLLIEYYDTKRGGYNCTFGGDGTHGHKVTQQQIERQRKSLKKYWSKERKSKHSEKMKLWFNNRPKNEQDKMRTGNDWWLNKGSKEKHLKNTRESLTSERIEKQRNSLKKYYKNNISKKAIVVSVISPTNEICVVNGTYQFCLDNHISYKNFMRVMKRETTEYKGWKLVSK